MMMVMIIIMMVVVTMVMGDDDNDDEMITNMAMIIYAATFTGRGHRLSHLPVLTRVRRA